MIYFKKIRWMNFLSTGNQWTEIDLCRSPSTLIVGENGSGKSTFLDALSFVLYGRAYRNINKPLLVNSITGKQCLVEIEFNLNGKSYFIRRGLKPAVFEIYCDDKLIDQSSNSREYQDYLEKNILKLNHKSFTQIVVIGSANFTPFMQLKPHERRSVIEDLLDIEIFTKMSDLLKEKISANRDEIRTIRYEIDMNNRSIQLTREHIAEMLQYQRETDQRRNAKIQLYHSKIEKCKKRIQKLEIARDKLMNTLKNKTKIENRFDELRNLNVRMNDKLKSILNEIEFFEKNDSCPTCHQSLNNDFKIQNIKRMNDKREELEKGLTLLREEYDRTHKELTRLNECLREVSKLNNEILTIESTIRNHMNSIKELEAEHKIENDTNTSEHDRKLKELRSSTRKLEKRYEQLLLLKEDLDIAYSLLRDNGIKSKIIKQYIPIINKMMNKYLAALEFFVHFELDENFNEKIKSRFRDEFCYDSFSEGEKMRIDISLLFTWRAIAKLKNSISTNLLVLDEVFDSSLDNSGTDEFLKMLSELTNETNVFIISHKGDSLYDKFHSNIRFIKTKNFSTIAAN